MTGSRLVGTKIALAIALGAAAAKAQAPASPPEVAVPPAPHRSAPIIPSDDARYPEKKVGVFVNPLGVLFGRYGGEFAYSVTDNLTANASAVYFHRSESSASQTTSNTAFGGGLGAQIFPIGRSFNRLYVFPSLTFLSLAGTHTSVAAGDVTVSAKVLGLGATVGYQWTWVGGFSLRLGLGALYYVVVAKVIDNPSPTTTVNVVLDGFAPAGDASIGWTF